ncbi:phosphoenolpyruvate carboxylase, partial [Salmonella enterica subsp. enterica serovar Anatum]|nr:phosphoenolpyruvate carboxylase [Salmonella enterica subsp. enterica serovar Anatum]
RERVEAVMNQHGFSPSRSARAMRGQSDKVVAIIVTRLDSLSEANRQELLTTLQNLSNDELLPVARAFSQFLNLANTAEQYHSI